MGNCYGSSRVIASDSFILHEESKNSGRIGCQDANYTHMVYRISSDFPPGEFSRES